MRTIEMASAEMGILVLLAVALPAAGDTWQIQTVDSAGGRYTSLALDSLGRPHISYHCWVSMQRPDRLKYAFWNGSAWQCQFIPEFNLDGSGVYSSLVLDKSSSSTYGHPLISSVDTNGLHLLLYDPAGMGVSWPYVTDVMGNGTSLALGSDRAPRISYRGSNRLKYWDGQTSQVQTVDSATYGGSFSSLALDGSDRPRISYYDADNYDLKYAAWDGSTWQLQTVDSVGHVGEYTSLELDNLGRPRISYYDRTNRDLKYAAWDGSSWQVQTVDSAGDVGLWTSLALDNLGRPRISYYDNIDATHGHLKYAAWDGSTWQIQTVDSAGDVGWESSLALDAAGLPHISYDDATNGDLKFAELVPHPGDATHDNHVNVDDLGILASNYDTIGGAVWETADFTGDGNVNVDDLGILASNYDWVGPGGATVPEPATLSLLALGYVLSLSKGGLATIRRRRAA